MCLVLNTSKTSKHWASLAISEATRLINMGELSTQMGISGSAETGLPLNRQDERTE